VDRRLADSLRNILTNPNVGLLFVIPGVGDTFRVNGRARIVTDHELLEPSAVEGKVPKLGLLIEIDEAFTHCSKAFLRSQLWDPERHVDRSELPSAGEIHRSLDASFDAEAYDAARAERHARRVNFYEPSRREGSKSSSSGSRSPRIALATRRPQAKPRTFPWPE
jgi:uncharacterized protein